MKNKIWMCVIMFALVIINVSCNNKIESNNIGSAKSLNDELENDAESDPGENSEGDSEDDPEDTDEYFEEKYSIYRNPIDKYFLPQIYSWDSSQVEIRAAQGAYKEAWKTEYQNVMKWLKKKCVYEEDKKNISLLEKNVADQIQIEKKVLKTELINAYKVNPDPSKVKNSCSRMSLQGFMERVKEDKADGQILWQITKKTDFNLFYSNCDSFICRIF